MRRRRTLAGALAPLLLLGGPAAAVVTEPTGPTAPAAPAATLAGRTVVIDPGHQLGNSRFPRQVGRLVPAGGFRKPCNTAGTASDAGYPEATFTWRVSLALRSRLEALGATVLMTRSTNSLRDWGPCVDVRGRAGNARGADLKISVHGDGSSVPGAHGFHVIYAPDRAPWTADTYRPSRRMARDTRAALLAAGLPVATYVAGGDGLDVRSDLATLNLSDLPTVLVELGNMRDAGDAALMTSASGQATYADALAAAASTFLAR